MDIKRFFKKSKDIESILTKKDDFTTLRDQYYKHPTMFTLAKGCLNHPEYYMCEKHVNNIFKYALAELGYDVEFEYPNDRNNYEKIFKQLNKLMDGNITNMSDINEICKILINKKQFIKDYKEIIVFLKTQIVDKIIRNLELYKNRTRNEHLTNQLLLNSVALKELVDPYINQLHDTVILANFASLFTSENLTLRKLQYYWNNGIQILKEINKEQRLNRLTLHLPTINPNDSNDSYTLPSFININ